MKRLGAVLVVTALWCWAAPSRAQESQTKKRPSVYDEIKQAPEKARARRNPLENDPEAVTAGGILFQQHCGECHGESGEGSRKGPSLRAAQVQNAEPGAIFWILTNGVVRKGMPVWSKLPEPQRWQIVSFIKSFGAAAKPANGSLSNPPPQKNAPKDSSLRRR